MKEEVSIPTTRWAANREELLRASKELADYEDLHGLPRNPLRDMSLAEFDSEMAGWIQRMLTSDWTETIQRSDPANVSRFLSEMISEINDISDYLSYENKTGELGRDYFRSLVCLIVQQLEIQLSKSLPALQLAVDGRLDPRTRQPLLFPVVQETCSDDRPRCGGKLKLTVRQAVLRRDEFTCQHCGRKAPDVALHVDHKTPHSFSQNGSAEICRLCVVENLWTLCRDCNLGKSNRYDDGEVVS